MSNIFEIKEIISNENLISSLLASFTKEELIDYIIESSNNKLLTISYEGMLPSDIHHHVAITRHLVDFFVNLQE